MMEINSEEKNNKLKKTFERYPRDILQDTLEEAQGYIELFEEIFKQRGGT